MILARSQAAAEGELATLDPVAYCTDCHSTAQLKQFLRKGLETLRRDWTLCYRGSSSDPSPGQLKPNLLGGHTLACLDQDRNPSCRREAYLTSAETSTVPFMAQQCSQWGQLHSGKITSWSCPGSEERGKGVLEGHGLIGKKNSVKLANVYCQISSTKSHFCVLLCKGVCNCLLRREKIMPEDEQGPAQATGYNVPSIVGCWSTARLLDLNILH